MLITLSPPSSTTRMSTPAHPDLSLLTSAHLAKSVIIVPDVVGLSATPWKKGVHNMPMPPSSSS